MTAKDNEVPQDTGKNGSSQEAGWLSKNIGDPVGVAYTRYATRVTHQLVVLYRRASTRVAGLILNTLEGILEMVPGGS